MSCLCIGGVCIPYSALIPCLLIALQWVASQFAKVGLLPDFVAKRLGLTNTGKKVAANNSSSGCETKACCSGKGTKSASRSDSIATTATNSSDSDGEGKDVEVEHVDNLSRWEEIFTSSKKSTLFVKFTADWCKPCKAIQPAYVSTASKHDNAATFITLDIDGDDCDVVSGKMKVAMMPTFVCFQNGAEAGRMSGGNSGERLNEWVSEMCS